MEICIMNGDRCFISKEGRFIHYTPQGNGSVIYCLFEDNQRNVWIGSNNGLEIYNLITKKKDFLNKENSQLLTNEIKAVSQDKTGIYGSALSIKELVYIIRRVRP